MRPRVHGGGDLVAAQCGLGGLREAQGSRSDRHRHLVARQDQTVYIDLTRPESWLPALVPCLLLGCTGEDGSPRFSGGPLAIFALTRQPPLCTTPAITWRGRGDIDNKCSLP